MKDKANHHELSELVKWVRLGSSEETYFATVKPIVDKNCVRCHGTIPHAIVKIPLTLGIESPKSVIAFEVIFIKQLQP